MGKLRSRGQQSRQYSLSYVITCLVTRNTLLPLVVFFCPIVVLSYPPVVLVYPLIVLICPLVVLVYPLVVLVYSLVVPVCPLVVPVVLSFNLSVDPPRGVPRKRCY